jgi:PBP1b-binding outer membrane lipoprotein LpoB
MMKKYILLLITTLIVIFSGCQTAGGGNPNEVLKHFFDSISKKDFTSAKKYATKDSDGMISMMEMGMQNMNSEHSDKMMEMIQNMQMGDAVINGDRATVSVKDKKSGEATDFLLKKENGDWKVAFDMSTLMEMGNKKLREHGMSDMDSMNGMMDTNYLKGQQKNAHAQKFMDSLFDSIRAEKLEKAQ